MENKNYSKNIKKDIKKEQDTNNKKKVFIIISIVLCVLALIFLGYKLFTSKDEDKNKNNKKEEIVEPIKEEKEEEEDEEEDEEYSYFSEQSYIQTINNEVDEKNSETNKETIIYRLTFNTNGGSEIEPNLFEENEATIEPAIPQRDGWSFAGWFKDLEFNEEYTFGSVLKEDTTIYAKWIKKITFVVNEEEVFSSDFAENSELALYTDETLENDDVAASWIYTLDGISKEAVEGMIVNEENFGTESYEVELIYNPLTKFDLKFNYGDEDTLIQKVVEGRKIDFTNIKQLVSEKYPELEKYSWVYFVEEDAWTFSEYQKADSSITELTLNIDTYKVTYEEEIIIDEETTDYEIIDEIEYGQDTKINLLEAEEKENKTFDGWYYDDGEESILIEDGYIIDKDMTLRGKWLDVEKELALAVNPEFDSTIEDQEKEQLEEKEEIEEIPEEVNEEIIEETPEKQEEDEQEEKEEVIQKQDIDNEKIEE